MTHGQPGHHPQPAASLGLAWAGALAFCRPHTKTSPGLALLLERRGLPCSHFPPCRSREGGSNPSALGTPCPSLWASRITVRPLPAHKGCRGPTPQPHGGCGPCCPHLASPSRSWGWRPAWGLGPPTVAPSWILHRRFPQSPPPQLPTWPLRWDQGQATTSPGSCDLQLLRPSLWGATAPLSLVGAQALGKCSLLSAKPSWCCAGLSA